MIGAFVHSKSTKFLPSFQPTLGSGGSPSIVGATDGHAVADRLKAKLPPVTDDDGEAGNSLTGSFVGSAVNSVASSVLPGGSVKGSGLHVDGFGHESEDDSDEDDEHDDDDDGNGAATPSTASGGRRSVITCVSFGAMGRMRRWWLVVVSGLF